MERLLEGRVAIVTGGGGGLGRGISEAFATQGAGVLVAEIDPERAQVTEAVIAAAGGDVSSVVLDVCEPDAGTRLVSGALERWGRLDIVVNNVGHFLFAGGRFEDSTEEQWDALDAVNLRHVLRLTRAALPALIEQGDGGSIINVSTVEAFRGIPHHPVYSAYKAALVAFTRSLAVDVGGHGIRVNGLAPDVTRSEQVAYDRWLSDEERAKVPAWVPLGRLGQPADTAGAAVFLASDLGSFVTGTTIPVDGGTLAAGGWYRTTREGRGWTNRPFDA